MKKETEVITKKIEGEEIKIVAKIVSTEESSFKIIDDEKGIFDAYVSVFGNIDSYGEVVDKGAFTEWLKEHKGRYPKGVWAHDWTEPIIKTIECHEDERGLYVKGQFVLAVQRAKEIYALMKEGVITDFSFGFRVIEDYIDPTTSTRHLKKLAIYEYSPVLVGANPQATLIGLKSDRNEADTDNQPTEDLKPEIDPEKPATDPIQNEDTEKEIKEGRILSAKTKTTINAAVNSMQTAIDALEALINATEDDDEGKSSDTSKVGLLEGKERLVIKGILREARKADKIIEKVIVRAKTLEK